MSEERPERTREILEGLPVDLLDGLRDGRQLALGEAEHDPLEYSPAGRKFRTFHNAHPAVYAEIVRRARVAKARGFSRYSVRDIYASMRWEFDTGDDRRGASGDVEYRLNNDYTPFYADLIMAREPDLAGFFQTRGR